MPDTSQLDAACIHTIKLAIEGILAAALISFLCMMYSCCVMSGKCSRAEEKRGQR